MYSLFRYQIILLNEQLLHCLVIPLSKSSSTRE